jgi:hypothetical protein
MKEMVSIIRHSPVLFGVSVAGLLIGFIIILAFASIIQT